jgi:hypothetical protein
MNGLPLFCERCGAEVEPGKGEFYVVRIEAFADPTPPSITAEDLQRDIAAEIERLLASMRDLSEQEAMGARSGRNRVHNTASTTDLRADALGAGAPSVRYSC